MAEQPEHLGLMASKLGGTELGTLLAGFAGSLITLRFLGPMPWYERAIYVIGGSAIAYWVTPLVVWVLNVSPEEPRVRDALACVVGVFGMSAIGAGLSVLSQFGANPLDWLRVALEKLRPKAP